MKFKLVCLFVIIIVINLGLFPEIVHIKIQDSKENITNLIQSIRTYEIRISQNSADIWLEDTELVKFKETGFYYEIISRESDWQRSISDYRTYAETYVEITDLAAENPSFVNLFSLGNSQGKLYYNESYGNYDDFQHNIWCLKVSDNPQVNEDEPNVYFAATIHAREPISLEVDMYILNHIVDNYGTDPDITFWVDNTQIWFIPLLNPDGHKLVREYYSYSHRKNIRDNDEDGNPDANNYDGVDLNRNFGYVWGPNGTSSTPSSSIYNGPYAWSEPEVVYVRDLLRTYNFWGGITYHSSGQWVLYPLGNLPGVCAYDHEIMGDLAVNMANTIPKYSSSGSHPQVGYYTPSQAVDFGYTCQGTMGDWGYSELRMFAYTLELSWTHIVSAEWIEQISEDNLEAALIFLDRVHHSTVTGNITDETRSPVVADVYVHEIDYATGMSEVEPVRSDSTYGRYYRVLEPGNYTFTFSLDGYDDIIVENVVVNDTSQTELNINFGTAAPYVANPLTSLIMGEDITDNSIDLNTVFAIDDEQDLSFTYSDNSNISVGITDGLVELSPAADWNGEETIFFQATSEDSLTVSEDLQVIVTPLNDLPYIANPIADFSFPEDTSDNSIDLNNVFSDVDLETRDSLSFNYVGNDSIAVQINSGLVTLTPAPDWFGSEEIIFFATDDSLATASDTVLVTVDAVNDPPFIELPDSVLVIMNNIFEEDFSQYVDDVDGDSLALSSSESENIVTELNDLIVRIIPDSNWVGEEILSFTVDDQVRAVSTDSLLVIVYADQLAEPEISSITLEAGMINIEWDPVPGATEYLIYSSDDAYSEFTIDESGAFSENTWISPFNGSRKFYKVKAKNDF